MSRRGNKKKHAVEPAKQDHELKGAEKSVEKSNPQKGNHPKGSHPHKPEVLRRQKTGKFVGNIFQWILTLGILAGLGLTQARRLKSLGIPDDFNPGPYVQLSFIVAASALIGWGFSIIYRGQISGGFMKTRSSSNDNSLIVGGALVLVGIILNVLLITMSLS